MSVPAVYTPITKAQMGWFSHQGKPCAEYEMDFFRCASRVGQQRYIADCHAEYQDFLECVNHRRQFERYLIMQAERKKQGRPFQPVPSPDIAAIF